MSRWFGAVAIAASALNARRPLPPAASLVDDLREADDAFRAVATAISAAQQAFDRRETFDLAQARSALDGFPSKRVVAVDIVERLARTLVARAEADRAAWCIARDGSGFCAPDEPWVDLSGRAHVVRVLERLLGGPCTRDDLAASVWPGERILPAALRNRVNVLLSTLRKAGLTLLITVPEGWALDPSTRVIVVRGPAR